MITLQRLTPLLFEPRLSTVTTGDSAVASSPLLSRDRKDSPHNGVDYDVQLSGMVSSGAPGYGPGRTAPLLQPHSSDGAPVSGHPDNPRDAVTSAEKERSGADDDSGATDDADDSRSGAVKDATGETLDKDAERLVQELRTRDQEVRTHEQAHKTVGGQYAGSISYEYQQGPDGVRYAVGGEVSIDVSPEREPAATIAKMRQVRAAAMAPAEPSPQDRTVAAEASQNEGQARSELRLSQQAGTDGDPDAAAAPTPTTDANGKRRAGDESGGQGLVQPSGNQFVRAYAGVWPGSATAFNHGGGGLLNIMA